MSLNKKLVFNAVDFEQSLKSSDKPLTVFQRALKYGRDQIQSNYYEHGNAELTVTVHAWLIDQLLLRVWKLHLSILGGNSNICLVAVGGYGRGELHPASDIDLMLLTEKHNVDTNNFIETFIRFLWDMGLEVGHSTRSLKDCTKEAKADITVATNLMESRLLIGSPELFDAMKRLTNAPKLWPSKKFFSAKLKEQHDRHLRYGDTSYNLEPNIKEGPGGLRDIQMILWVVQRHFHINSLSALVDHDFLSKQEYKLLIDSRNFLWKVRNSLHYSAKRREDRLLFDYQRILADQFGYFDSKESLAVEQFMKHYYRTIKELNVVNEILLQHFNETILSSNKLRKQEINARFHNRGGYLAVSDNNIFNKQPGTILELFLLLEQHPRLKGVRAETIRLLRANLHRIDDSFRNDEQNQHLFMEIIRQPRGITHELRRMNAYGVLGAYIPAFGQVVGQMQHDLFHVYTVDEHSLFVVRNMRRLSIPEFYKELPFASSIFRHLMKPERLYVAGLFHDIAKGRGGNHSELGAEEVKHFCKLHQFSDYDTQLISWLVENHLIMSWRSQRQDISDPTVVKQFAQQVGDQEHLDNLYLLTVADMRGTSPRIWNEWKGHLLMQLYQETSRLLSHGVDSEIDVADHIQQRRKGALEILDFNTQQRSLLDQFWQGMDDSYFLGYEPDSLAWHGKAIVSKSAAEFPLSITRFKPEIGGTEFLFYTSGKSDVLVKLTHAFDKHNLSIVDARINTTAQGFILTSFVVLDLNGKAVKSPKLLAELERTFVKELLSETPAGRLQSNQVSRQLKHFPIETKVTFSKAANNKTTIMEVIAQDRPGLLFQVASALYFCKIKLIGAKISTFGERAEDIFFITDFNDQFIDNEQQLEKIRSAIHSRLNPDDNKISQLKF